MPALRKAGYRLTLEDYARVYCCTITTVVHWRDAGAPLDDPKVLLCWLSRRRGHQPLPRRLRAQFRFGKGTAGVVEAFDSLAAKSAS